MASGTQFAEDKRCLERAASGDRTSFALLYDRYAGMTYAVILKILKDPSDAEDCLQEVWLEAWNRAATYDPARGAVPAWLLVLARSRALDRIRSRSSRQLMHSRAEAGDAPAIARPADPSAHTEDAQLRARMRRALDNLEPHHRQVLELAYWEGLSQSQIAERMKSPLGTVKSWTRQGLSRLNELVPREEWS